MSKASEEKALETIKEYMISQNRPYSATDVLTNLRKEFSKTIVVKTLEALATSGVLVEKLVSKQKIYYPNQNNFPSFDDNQLMDFDQDIAKLTETHKETKSLFKSLETELKTAYATLTTIQLQEKVSGLETEVEQMEAKLTEIKESAGRVEVEEGEKARLAGVHASGVREWRRRKRMASEMLESILENCNKKKKDLFEEIGVETDEEHKALLPII